MNSICRTLLLFTVLATTVLLAGCGGGGGGGGGGIPQGTLQVGLTDAPACGGFDAVNVTVAKVRVHQSASANENDAGWSDITLNPARKINLLNLSNGTLDNLGQTPLPAGHYTQLRLVLVANSAAQPLANSVLPTGGTETALDTPSGIQSGIKLINQFDVAADTLVDLVLDFNACKSVVTKGNGGFSLMPVIRVVPTVVSGGIAGFVDPALAPSHPVVSAQQSGAVVQSTVPDATGAFTLSPLIQSSTAGTYTVVVTADGHASAVIDGVPVTAKANVVISTNAPPIALPASTIHSVSGTVLLTPPSPTTPAFVTAKQSFSSGPTVSIGSDVADLLTGDYSLTLPVAAPLLGEYGSGTLPVTLTAQPTPAGMYAIEASAAGYTTQAVNTDITSTNVTAQNFTLVP